MRQWEIGEALAKRAQGLLNDVRAKLDQAQPSKPPTKPPQAPAVQPRLSCLPARHPAVRT